MREYSKVRPRFWTGDTGREIRKLGPQCQVVAFYLFTCPSANMIGLYYIGLPTLCHETGSPLKGAMESLRSLSEVGFAHYDVPSEHVYLPNMAREQIGERLQKKDNRHIAVLRELEQLRKTPFFRQFVEKYRVAFELDDIELGKPLESPSEGSLEALGSQEQEQEQAQEHEHGGAAEKLRPWKRFPPEFAIPSELSADLAQELPPDFDLIAEERKLRDHEFAKARIDPSRVYRNWMRTARDGRNYARKPKANGSGPKITEQLDAPALLPDGRENPIVYANGVYVREFVVADGKVGKNIKAVQLQ